MFAAANVVAYPAQDAAVHRWSYGSGQNATSEEPIDSGDRQRPEELALRVGVVIEDSAGYNWRRERDSNFSTTLILKNFFEISDAHYARDATNAGSLYTDCTQASSGGERGIRTPDTLSGMPVFKTGAINHSASSP